MLESAGLRKGLVPHPLYPSPPDGIVPRLGVCTDRYFWNLHPFLPLTRATSEGHTCPPVCSDSMEQNRRWEYEVWI